MSIIAEALAPCSKCGRQHQITIYKSINTAENPEIKDRIKDGSLFIWECPSCGQSNLAKYETLYHDPEQKIMIWLIPGGDLSETQMQAISNHAKAIGNYRLRRVGNTGALMEKILVFDAGLDDAVIELCKFVTKMELAEKINDPEQKAAFMAAPMHFFRSDGNALTFMYPSDKQMMSLETGYNVYQDCEGILSRNPDIIPSDTFLRIDQTWLSNVMK